MTAIGNIGGFEWQEDGSATVWGRVTARDGTGAATGILGEGNFVKQADLLSITCKVFDRSSTTPDTSTATPTIIVSDVILDTPDSSGLIAVDDAGTAVTYNFRCDLSGTNFPTGNHRYLVEFYFTTTGSKTWCVGYEAVASPVVGS